MTDPKYELFVNIVGALNVLCIGLRDFQSGSQREIVVWLYAQVLINALFFIELLVDLLVHGTQSFRTHFRVWPETFCQLLNIYATALFFMNLSNLTTLETKQLRFGYVDANQLIKYFELIIFWRILKVLTLLYEIRAMRLIIETMRNMLLPLMQLMGVLFVIFYIFSIAGMYMFGGLITKDLASIVND